MARVKAPRGRVQGAAGLAIQAAHLVPVRHHSPRSSAIALAVLEAVRPALVLVEGPEDATALVPLLVDRQTRPPVALLAYRTDRGAASALWPFASYSPEYVAIRWASEHGVPAAFFDVPTTRALAPPRPRAKGAAPAVPAQDGAPRAGPEAMEADDDSVHERAARAAGFGSFEELWEACFEAPAHDVEGFRAAIVAYAELIRAAEAPEPLEHDGGGASDRAREAFMARCVEERAAEVGAGRIVVVAGASHVAAFARGDVDLGAERALPKPVETAITVIPFSFPRLAEQLGYGAGNRAPMVYERAHAAGSFDRAALETLLELAQHLRVRGFSASLADALEGYRLARALTTMRGKAAPGVEEIRDAAVATLCKGDATHVEALLWPVVVGRNVGQVAAHAGKNALEEEFWRMVRERGLPIDDALEPFSLALHNEVEVETSVFLHRLRVLGIPYATLLGGPRAGAAAPGAVRDEAGGFSALTRMRESWEAQWTPATDVALVEAIALGESLAAAATRALARELAEVKGTAAAAGVLLEAIVTSSGAAVSAALDACDRLAATDDDVGSLAAGARALATLASFGTSRARTPGGDAAVRALLDKVFSRAVLRAEGAAAVDDEAAPPVLAALRTLHEIALTKETVDGSAWVVAARRIAASEAVNPAAAGHAQGLLYLMQAATDEDVAAAIALRMGGAREPRRAARYLEGFVEVNALAIVKSRPVVAALDAFLVGIDASRFADALPVLRRAFARLGPSERRYLVENLLGLRRARRGEDGGAARLEADKATLAAMQGELAQAMEDLDDLL